jgi:pimeloyl-ACP methyl ester carboxylesterase
MGNMGVAGSIDGSVKALPHAPNGKLDRRALPAPDRECPGMDMDVTAPRTAIQKRLADDWAAILKLEKIGIHDNFFELGGDSILAIQACARAKNAGLGITPLELFVHPTIAQLASLVEVQTISVPVIEPFFFGPLNRRIFATFHPSASGNSVMLTVICPPLFSEYMRVHAALRKLAILLAEHQQDVLRFDYRGTGDSFEDLSAVTIADWVDDIASAVREGRDLSRSGAVQVVGVRAGALLACKALGKSRDIRRFVLWDPVPSGAYYLRSLRSIQAKMLERIPLTRADRREAVNEYGGHRLSDPMIAEFRSLDASAYSSVPKSKLHIISTSAAAANFPVQGATQCEESFTCGWENDTTEDLLMPTIVLERLTSCLTTS